ncbi:Stp1/IreP family PP2C-type Ser/Thr phosphatase [Lentibacillus cibarius]|uniref:protein-serine/threonine phosphatase n=1 Tax=Lentibacillus cibarius TaxID=2583219 RepID=A0A549YKE5_9BACI|nr:Stp1/IreP family PP2C-type Ser/Thr phosphatase [Lentibacillus cibarius]TRM12351.1 Stp1/IreP family PP2C-type Ser/Thr phosphatase [Lentibacillus cibarius]
MKGVFQTDQGQVRSHNEDSGGIFYNQTGELLAIVADGMGGHQAGDVASQMATAFVQEKWEKTDAMQSPEAAEDWLQKTIKDMNTAILDHARENEECAGMGTTAVIVICTNRYATISHIGDSRCYIWNDHGLSQVTEDHSLVNELVRTGQITKDDAEQHPRRNVLLKALGTDEHAYADLQTLEWEAGHKLLLCSDGLTNKLTDDEMEAFLQKDIELETIANELINLANERGGEDNISLIILQHDVCMEAGGT